MDNLSPEPVAVESVELASSSVTQPAFGELGLGIFLDAPSVLFVRRSGRFGCWPRVSSLGRIREPERQTEYFGLMGQECRRLTNPMPVLMLNAKSQIEDRVTGLDAGADDYLVKPFSTRELLARVRALLRRAQKPGKTVRQLTLGPVRIDLARQTATRGRRVLHLSAREFAMLRVLAEADGQPLTRDHFLDVVWGYTAFPTTRTVDNHIAALRAKLEPDPEHPRYLKTVHGVGYRLDWG